ncbi:hypothetical protein L21SP2_2259 [Salinispira pacifica]|uniref:Uncharacterized protein n=2 Tax=Salinispira pacifica TaxID=1307761 RepID=V5WJ18_9SPIO|nr:hypothetical protein L21SP2_2259 [Salinispira pacifica]
MPVLDSEGEQIQNFRLKSTDEQLTLDFSPPLEITPERQVLQLDMSLPDADLLAEVSEPDGDEPARRIPVSIPRGMSSGRTVLEYQLSAEGLSEISQIVLRKHADGPESTAESSAESSPARSGQEDSPFTSLLAFRLLDDFSALEIDDYRIRMPWYLSYNQRLLTMDGAPATGTETGAGPALNVYQEAEISSLMDDFPLLDYVPVIRLGYEYRKPEAGMPVRGFQEDEEAREFADPLPPLARVDLFSGESGAAPFQSFELRLRPGQQSVYLYPEMFSQDISAIRFTHDSVHGRMRALELLSIPRSPTVESPGPLPPPLPMDLGMIMNYSRGLWRNPEMELYSWNLFPQVLIIDFRDYELQARYLKRLAYFVEKEGFRGELLTNAQLAGRHGWNAHNYHPRDLSRFYNRAADEGFPLNEEELNLLELLLQRGILTENGGEYLEGEGQIISITDHPLQTEAARRLFLNHEALHGMFYNFPEFRELSTQLWNGMEESSREYLEYYFSYVGYDPEDSYLMINEFQAYMLQQDIVNLRWMVQSRMAPRILRRFPALENFVYGNNVDTGWEALRAGEALQTLIYQNYGLTAGDLFGLVPWEGDAEL